MSNLRKVIQLYREHAFSFWTGFWSAFCLVSALSLGLCTLIALIFDLNFDAFEQVEGALGMLPFALFVAAVAGVIGVTVSYACRNVHAGSKYRWLWLSLVVAQVGCVVAQVGCIAAICWLMKSDFSSFKELWTADFWRTGSDVLIAGCSYGGGFWLIEVFVILALRVYENVVRKTDRLMVG